MIDRDHGIKAIIAAGVAAILTVGGLLLMNAGTAGQAAPAQQMQQAQEDADQPPQEENGQLSQEEAGPPSQEDADQPPQEEAVQAPPADDSQSVQVYGEQSLQEDSGQSSQEDAGQIAYEDREIPVFRERETNETIKLRFYEDLPNVAYVNIEDYHHLYLPEAVVTAERISTESDVQPEEGSGVYLVRNETGAAVIDTEKETLSSEDLPAFTNVMGLIQPGMANTYLDGLPYVRWVREERNRNLSSVKGPEQLSEEAGPVTLDYAEN